jgi:hypothetical protein
VDFNYAIVFLVTRNFIKPELSGRPTEDMTLLYLAKRDDMVKRDDILMEFRGIGKYSFF